MVWVREASTPLRWRNNSQENILAAVKSKGRGVGSIVVVGRRREKVQTQQSADCGQTSWAGIRGF